MGRILDSAALGALGLPFLLLVVALFVLLVWTLSWWLAGVLLAHFAFERLVVALLVMVVLIGGASGE